MIRKRVCDVPLNELKIGQVVRFPAQFAAIIQINCEIAGHKIQWDSIKSSDYKHNRYSTVSYIMENGRVVTPMFHMNNEYELTDRVLTEQELCNFDRINWGNFL